MAATKVGVVHAAVSGIIRRVIVPDDDAELNLPSHVGQGEAMLLVQRGSLGPTAVPSVSLARAAVATAMGVAVPSGRCVLVDAAGAVAGALMADPALDAVPGYTLMLSDFADVGWTLVNGVLTAPAVKVSAGAAA